MRLRLTRAASAAMLVVVAAAAPASAAPASDKPTSVIVTNTADNPVPVAISSLLEVIGTLKLDPSANTVKLDPAANTVSPAPLERFQARKALHISLSSGEKYGFFEVLTVPAGKRFVSDFVTVTGKCSDDDAASTVSQSSLTVDGRQMDIPLDVTHLHPTGQLIIVQQALPIVVWADAGTKVLWDLQSTAASCGWDMNLAGHFEPLS